jgi:arylsulfatase A
MAPRPVLVSGGGKGSTRHTGTHVPLIATWPGIVPAGRVSLDLIDSTDFLPTVCAAAGIDIPADWKVDGRSFLPQLRGEQGSSIASTPQCRSVRRRAAA